MNGIKDTKNETPILKNDEKMYVYLKGSHFQQNNVLTTNNDHVINDNVINIYIVYKLDPVTSEDTTFTIQNVLFGAMQITKNTDTSKYNYKGYGLCFDESEEFTHVRKRGNFSDTTDGRNVIIFGVDMSFSKHANNKANKIYVMGKDYIQKINNTKIYAEKMYYRNFTDPGKKFVLSLHYNGNNSYLYVNGNQELKFKAKTDQLVKEKLCLGNLSDQWATSESEKTGLHGKIYDFVVDYEHMWLINLAISLFGIIKTKALECLSVVNQKCMARPKILDVNEGICEALFYLYNVQVNKCSGNCNTLDNPMVKLCVPNVIKGVNMQVYNFLMRLNETRNVLWHESCKCVCKLNSSVCNNKQIWNSDTCRCDCNEDFAGIISCAKGYTWNPSICECQCDKWCKPGQYLDHKNCICKNKLIRRLIE